MRPDRLIDPSQDLDRSVGESLGTRNQRSIVDEIASASKSGRRKRIEIRDDGVIVGDADIIDFTGSGLVATVLGNVATVDGSAGGGGGTTIAVQEGDVTESLTVSVIDFLDADFDVTISPAGEANVSIADNYVLNTGDTITGDLLLQSTSATQLRATNAGGTEYFRVDTSNNIAVLLNAADFLAYSDNGSTVVYGVDGATGVVTFGLPGGATVASIRAGTGSPEGVVSAQVGSLFLRSDGGTDTAVYRKESGTGNTGWVAVSSSGSGLTHPQVMSRAWLVS